MNVWSRKRRLGHQSPGDVWEKQSRIDDDVALHWKLTEEKNGSLAAEILEGFVAEGGDCWTNPDLCLKLQSTARQHELDELLLEHDRGWCGLSQRWQVRGLDAFLADGRFLLRTAMVDNCKLLMKSVQNLAKLDSQFVSKTFERRWTAFRCMETRSVRWMFAQRHGTCWWQHFSVFESLCQLGLIWLKEAMVKWRADFDLRRESTTSTHYHSAYHSKPTLTQRRSRWRAPPDPSLMNIWWVARNLPRLPRSKMVNCADLSSTNVRQLIPLVRWCCKCIEARYPQAILSTNAYIIHSFCFLIL